MKNTALTAFLLSLSLLLLSSHAVFARNQANKTIKIAVLDSGFCIKFIEPLKGVTFESAWFATPSVFNIQCDHEKLNSPRFHGQRVLQVFVKEWRLHQSKLSPLLAEITPIIMLDKDGLQSVATWKNALKKIEKEKYDIVISAIGFAFKNLTEVKKENLKLPEGPTYFFAAGEKVGSLAHAELFPQIEGTLPKNKNIHLVGIEFFDGKKWIKQPQTFYLDYVNDWATDNYADENLLGSSFAAPQILVQWLYFNKNQIKKRQ